MPCRSHKHGQKAASRMTLAQPSALPVPEETVNVARRLVAMARQRPQALAIIAPGSGRGADGRRQYQRFTFAQLDQDSDRVAAFLAQQGVRPGQRLVLLVRPSFDFVSLVFGLLKSGAVQVLVDPGMGRRNLVACLAEAEPDGFVAIPPVQAVRAVLRRKFPRARLNLTVGRRWFWGGATLEQVRRMPWPGTQVAASGPDDPAAIIFTSGSTGIPKGVLYTHQNFDQQVQQIRDHYQIQPGQIDLPCFPLFALFNAAMGVTAVLPEMDATRPAQVDPAPLVEAIHDWNVTQSFASPAVWHRVGPYCREHGLKLPSLRRVFSAGAPVPARVLATLRECLPDDAEIHTPYGATESLPVASISASEVLGPRATAGPAAADPAPHDAQPDSDTAHGSPSPGTAALTRLGAGICVGRRFSGIRWCVLPIADGPIDERRELPAADPGPETVLHGPVGELAVCGPVVTKAYVTRREVNRLAKLVEGDTLWHRLGDVGYLDHQERFWFCGRLSQRVVTPAGTRFTIPCEAIFNNHPRVARSALVGVPLAGSPNGAGGSALREGVMVVEPWADQFPRSPAEAQTFRRELLDLAQGSPLTRDIAELLFYRSLPVDVRHNAKIFREQLAAWAAEKLGRVAGRQAAQVAAR